MKIRDFLFRNGHFVRIFGSIICGIALFLFFHFREVRLEVLEINAPAPKYIVAQVDFEFPDYETTIVLRQEATKDIGAIYQIDEREIHAVRLEIENELIQDKKWRAVTQATTFEEMYKAADLLETYLFEVRFTDPRTIQKIKDLRLPEQQYFDFIPDELTNQLPEHFWQFITQKLLNEGSLQKEAVGYLVKAFQSKSWTFIEDRLLGLSIRNQVSQTIPEKYTRVEAGSHIVGQGEQVTSRHLAMMQSMKKAISDSRKLEDPFTMLSSFLLTIILLIISGAFLRITEPNIYFSNRKMALLFTVVILSLGYSKLVELAILKSSSNFIESIKFPIVCPFGAILTCILLGPWVAIFNATILSVVCSVNLAVNHSQFLVLNLIGSMVVIVCGVGLRKRKEVFSVCFKSWIVLGVILLAYTLTEDRFWSSGLGIELITSLGFMFVIAVLAVGILPVLESIFGILTDMTLMEYMDPNNELLRRLAIEVPGTYQHSLVLGNLSESCAQAIGANGIFCRAATLYHDVGKVLNPQYFTENEQGAPSPHSLLFPLESAQIIIAHVTDGEMLAKKNKLPQPFIDIIREHHGTSLLYGFYQKQLEQQKDDKVPVAERSQFCYPGPTPRTKESAIIMICDGVEAASRSLELVNETTITELVNRIVKEREEERQLDDCLLTFQELSKVKKTLVKGLLLSHHSRVKYPKREKV
jgi:putative nucleotidyltransferase with HDIG domain